MSSWISRKRRLQIYARDNFTCIYCKRDLEEIVLSLDHLHPRSLGGSNNANNLITACISCNSQKSTHPLETFLKRCSDDPAKIARKIRRQIKKELK